MLDHTSFLGGAKMEGVVIKNYLRFGKDGKALMGKFVSEEFKEVHRGTWKTKNPTQSDIITNIVSQFSGSARWIKTVHRLRDTGRLENTPKDIGLLIKDVQADLKEECEGEIKELLFNKYYSTHNGLKLLNSEEIEVEELESKTIRAWGNVDPTKPIVYFYATKEKADEKASPSRTRCVHVTEIPEGARVITETQLNEALQYAADHYHAFIGCTQGAWHACLLRQLGFTEEDK